MRLHHLPGFGSLLFVLACGGEDRLVPPADPCPANLAGVNASTVNGVQQWSVLPTATGSCVTLAQDSHFVYVDPSRASVGRLFVFLPGTGGVARDYRLIAQEASRAGYHAIALTYPNDQAIGVLCAGRAGSCYAEARQEILTGTPVSNVVQVDRDNSIERRLALLLGFMQTVDAARDWRQFSTSDGRIDWSRVSVAGHSQGGGHALFIARQLSVLRASAFGSPGDVLPLSGAPAPWVSEPFVTPAERIYGFISTRDEIADPDDTIAAWGVIGLDDFGAPVNVDDTAAPFSNSHILLTSRDAINPGLVLTPQHNMPAVDVNTPRVAGTTAPLFSSVWRYLAFPAP